MSQQQSFDLEAIFAMISPTDMAGSLDFSHNQTAGESVTREILNSIINTDAKGVLSVDQLKQTLDGFLTNASSADQRQFFQLLRFYSTAGYLSDQRSQAAEMMQALDQHANSIEQVEFRQITGVPIAAIKPMCIVLSDSPYIHPSLRNVTKAEIFLNSMPSIVMSRCVPYLDVEFQFDRLELATKAQSAGMLKFLLGTGETEITDGTANQQMLDARRRKDPSIPGNEFEFAGMEMFTSPQTLVNPLPLPQGARSVEVLDPFRPYMSLTGAEISVTPTVGMFTYKKAKLMLRLHDRSRLADVSDLIKPEIYTKTTIWLTYGWRHPAEPGNPFGEFINDNMLVREAYGIVNSSFVFDPTGGVSITLELFTKMAKEVREIKIAEGPESNKTLLKQLDDLRNLIGRYRNATGIDVADGVNKEIRPFQLLDAAERGELPDWDNGEIGKAISRLRDIMRSSSQKIDQALQQQLVSDLHALPNIVGKVQNNVSTEVKKKFNEALEGPDPFLPTTKKAPNHPFSSFVDDYNKAPKSNSALKVKKRAVSFGKVFSSFVLPALSTRDEADEVQVYFYAFNGQAGPASGTNIAEFPIDMPVFLDQWAEHVKRRGTENLTLDEFMSVLVNAQINDPRAIAYGLRKFYTYDTKKGFEEPSQNGKDAQQQQYRQKLLENAEASLINKYGPFKKPVIQMYIEVLPVGSGALRDPVDLAESAAGSATQQDGNLSPKRIMKIHIYDKQLNPYRAQLQLLKASDGTDTYVENSASQQSGLVAQAQAQTKNNIKQLASTLVQSAQTSQGTNNVSLNQIYKDLVSRTVPTIVYGSNGTNVINASLSSQQEPLLSTVQMLRAGKQNNTQPNGSGVGGLPLRIIPAALALTTVGCPLLNLAQIWFVDFNTGTTADMLYILTQLTHTFSPGKFESQATMSYADGYGTYEGHPNIIKSIEQFAAGQQSSTSNANQKQGSTSSGLPPKLQ